MAFCEERQSLMKEIAFLQGRQLTMHQEAALEGWTREQSLLAFDARLAHIARLMRQLAVLDERRGLDQDRRLQI